MKINEILDIIEQFKHGDIYFHNLFFHHVTINWHSFSHIYIRDMETSDIFSINTDGKWCRFDEGYLYYRDDLYSLNGDYELYDPYRIFGIAYITPTLTHLSEDESLMLFHNIIQDFYTVHYGAWYNGITVDYFSFDMHNRYDPCIFKAMTTKYYKRTVDNGRKEIGIDSIPIPDQIPSNSIIIIATMHINSLKNNNPKDIETVYNTIKDSCKNQFNFYQINLIKDYGLYAN